MTTWLAALLTAPFAFLVWAYLHESAHVFVIRRCRSDARVEHFLYPHIHEGRWYWARVSWWVTEPLTRDELGRVAIAPRVPDAVGILAAPFAAHLLDGWVAACAAVLIGGSIVDLAVGSIGWSPESDLQRVVAGWGWPQFALRFVGWTAALASGAATAFAFA